MNWVKLHSFTDAKTRRVDHEGESIFSQKDSNWIWAEQQDRSCQELRGAWSRKEKMKYISDLEVDVVSIHKCLLYVRL